MRTNLHFAIASLFGVMSAGAYVAPVQAKAGHSSASAQLIFEGATEPYPAYSSAFAQKDGELNLASLLAVQQGISLFYDYLRSISHVNERTMVGLQKTTLFAPSNPTILHLARKPHQGPSHKDDSVFTSEEDKEKSNYAYLDRWVSSHAIEAKILPEGLSDSSKERKNMDGKVLKIECPNNEGSGEVRTDGKGEDVWKGCKVEGAEIIGFAEASNGVVYTIDGTISVKDDK